MASCDNSQPRNARNAPHPERIDGVSAFQWSVAISAPTDADVQLGLEAGVSSGGKPGGHRHTFEAPGAENGYAARDPLPASVAGRCWSTTKRPRPIALPSCSVPRIERSARCGIIEVLENPDRPESHRLEIHFVVIPAANGHSCPDPIVPLMGGPGEAAIDAAETLASKFAPMLNDRDLLLVDQRGTGRSAALRCQFFSPDDPAASLQNLFPLTAVG